MSEQAGIQIHLKVDLDTWALISSCLSAVSEYILIKKNVFKEQLDENEDAIGKLALLAKLDLDVQAKTETAYVDSSVLSHELGQAMVIQKAVVSVMTKGERARVQAYGRKK
jgi:hypothetical protein